MKKILYPAIFFLFAPITLLVSLFSLWHLERLKTAALLPLQKAQILGVNTSLELYSALPPTIGSVEQAFATSDARPLLIKNYLEKYQSPISDYADLLFQASEKWGLDYRLIPAIAQCESNLCKKIPPDSYNCWGFGNGETKFDSWEQAFESVAKTLKKKYIDQGLVTPEQIMPKYVPPSVAKGGPWAKCVNQYLQELE